MPSSVSQPTINAATATRDNLVRIAFLVTQVVASPTPANIDAAVAAVEAGTSSGRLILKPDYSVDGKSYQWSGYLEALQRAIEAQNKLIQMLSGSYIVTSRGVV